MEEEECIKSNRKRLHQPADKFVRYEPDPDTPVYDGRDCDAYIDGKNHEHNLSLIDSPAMVVCYSFDQSHNTTISDPQSDALPHTPDLLPGIHFDIATDHTMGRAPLERINLVSDIQAGDI